jgi:two-component system LytT family response regulator
MANRIKALVVDDEFPARENLKLLLAEYCPDIACIGEAGNITDAREKILTLKPELVFLDIRMPSGIEGFDLLDSLPEKNFTVVFVTAFKEFAIKAFKANAIHYILKPVDIDELKAACEKVTESLRKGTQFTETYFETLEHAKSDIENKAITRISISHVKGIKIVKTADIIYLEADGNCTRLHFADGSSYFDTRTLKIYEEMLDEKNFYRIHKSYLINLDYLKEYISEDGHFAVLNNAVKLPVGRARAADFTATIKKLT